MQAWVQVGDKFEDFDGLCQALQLCDRLMKIDFAGKDVDDSDSSSDSD